MSSGKGNGYNTNGADSYFSYIFLTLFFTQSGTVASAPQYLFCGSRHIQPINEPGKETSMNLTDLREIMGLTTAQVAEELGVPKQDVEDSEETGSTYLLPRFIAAFPINPAILTDPDADPFLESYVQNDMKDRTQEWRESNGLTLEDMAAALGMTAGQLSAMEESGKITRALGIKIEKTVGMNRKWLMYGDGRNRGTCIMKPEKQGSRAKPAAEEGEKPENGAARAAPNREAGLRVRSARKEAGLTREEVARLVGVSVSRIAQMESGYIRDSKAEEIIQMIQPQLSGRELGLQLREARKAAGLKLKEAAELAGVAAGTLAAMECGHISGTRAAELIEVIRTSPKPQEAGTAFSLEAGIQIREERKAAGLSQKELGVILRLPQSAVGRMEIGYVTEQRAKEIIRRIHGEPRHSGTARKVKQTTKVLLGRQIRDARESAGLSQKAMGDLVGLPQSRISLIEKGQVDEATKARILRALEAEMSRKAASGEDGGQ